MHENRAISFQFVIILLTMFTQSDYYGRRKVLNGDTFCGSGRMQTPAAVHVLQSYFIFYEDAIK